MLALDRFNALPEPDARRELAACCAARRFIEAVAAGRPYRDQETLRGAVDSTLTALDWDEVAEALAAHPRIGERAASTGREAAWSAAEQSAAASGAATTRQKIAEGNIAYEKRFGHVFLICANGRPADDILAALTVRLRNDPDTERAMVREELRKIVHLRMEKVLTS